MLYRCGSGSSRVGGPASLLRPLTNMIAARFVGTRLAAKPFLISLLVIMVLAVVGFLSFHAVGNLVSVNREIATRTIPAVRLAASTREAITPLVRLEMRALVLGDSSYATAWNERAVRVTEDLEHLAGYVQSKREAQKLAAARGAFEHYRSLVATEQDLLRRGAQAQALALPYSEARTRAEEVQENLDGLMAAIQVVMFRKPRLSWLTAAHCTAYTSASGQWARKCAPVVCLVWARMASAAWTPIQDRCTIT